MADKKLTELPEHTAFNDDDKGYIVDALGTSKYFRVSTQKEVFGEKNKDTILDEGGANEVTAEEIRSAVDSLAISDNYIYSSDRVYNKRDGNHFTFAIYNDGHFQYKNDTDTDEAARVIALGVGNGVPVVNAYWNQIDESEFYDLIGGGSASTPGETRVILRKDTSDNWISSNPILINGEEGYETDTRKRKVGDGSTAWNDLEYDTSSHEKGYFATESALTTAHPTGTDGDYAIVGTTDTVWVWDSDTSAWVDSGVSSGIAEVENTTLPIRNRVKYPLSGSPSSFGDSITEGQLASPSTESYVNKLAVKNSVTITNRGYSSRGVAKMIQAAYQYMATYLNTNSITTLTGYNDLRRGGSATATLEKIKGAHRATIVNNWLKFAVAASAATNTGTWSLFNTIVGKGAWLGGSSRQSSTVNDTISYTTTEATDNIVIGVVNSDGTTYNYGRLEITIDGVVVETFDPNGKTDNITDTVYDNGLVHNVLVYQNLGNSTHTVSIKVLDAKPTIVDYIGYMMAPKDCPAVFVGSPPKMPADGYPIGVGMGSDEVMEAGAAAIKSVCDEFPDRPVAFVEVNEFYDVSTGVDADLVHPNNLGHTQLAQAFQSAIKDGVGSSSASVTAATQTEVNTGTNTTKFVSASTLAGWWTNAKTLAQTFAAKITFTLAPRFSSVLAGQYLKVDVNKDLEGVDGVDIEDIIDDATITTVSYTTISTDRNVQSNHSAPVTHTLDGTGCNAGKKITVYDVSTAGAGTNNITIAAQSGQTIVGNALINSNGGTRTYIWDGTSKWTLISST